MVCLLPWFELLVLLPTSQGPGDLHSWSIMLTQQPLSSSLSPADSILFHPSHFYGFYMSGHPGFHYTLTKKKKKKPLRRGLTSTQGRKETKTSVGTLDWIILFIPSYSTQSAFIYLDVGVPFQILSLSWTQAGSCCSPLSLELFVFGLQLS